MTQVKTPVDLRTCYGTLNILMWLQAWMTILRTRLTVEIMTKRARRLVSATVSDFARNMSGRKSKPQPRHLSPHLRTALTQILTISPSGLAKRGGSTPSRQRHLPG